MPEHIAKPVELTRLSIPWVSIRGIRIKQGFPNRVNGWEGEFGQNGQKLHENDKIVILVSKQWGGHMEGGKLGGGRLVGGSPQSLPPPPPPPARGNPVRYSKNCS